MSNVPAFASATDAAKAARAALGFLAAVDPTRLVAGEQAQCLQILEQVSAMGTAARASVLGAFTAGRGFCEDGDYGPRSWLIHRTRITKGAAAWHTGWAQTGRIYRRERAAEMVMVSATVLDNAAEFRSWLVLSLCGRGLGMPCRIVASIATATGSSICSGSPCPTREHRASSAPVCEMVSAPHCTWRVALWQCDAPCSSHRSSQGLCTCVYVQTRARKGRDHRAGRSLTVTAPGGPRASVHE